MKILVLGHGRHGKDTFAELLMQKYTKTKLNFVASSEYCAKALLSVLSTIFNYKNETEAFNDRHNHRDLWKSLICLYNASDKAALARDILKESDIYVGMRCEKEYAACVKAKLFDVIFYVDAANRIDYIDPTMAIEFDINTMVLIDNNHDMENLNKEVDLSVKLLEAY